MTFESVAVLSLFTYLICVFVRSCLRSPEIRQVHSDALSDGLRLGLVLQELIEMEKEWSLKYIADKESGLCVPLLRLKQAVYNFSVFSSEKPSMIQQDELSTVLLLVLDMIWRGGLDLEAVVCHSSVRLKGIATCTPQEETNGSQLPNS